MMTQVSLKNIDACKPQCIESTQHRNISNNAVLRYQRNYLLKDRQCLLQKPILPRSSYNTALVVQSETSLPLTLDTGEE